MLNGGEWRSGLGGSIGCVDCRAKGACGFDRRAGGKQILGAAHEVFRGMGVGRRHGSY